MTGHQGLPPSTAELVAAALRDKLAGYGPNVVGVTMLGPGADQLFARIVLELGGSLHVVVPAARYRDGFEDQDAREGYDELFARAANVEQLAYVESTERAHLEGGKAVVDRAQALWQFGTASRPGGWVGPPTWSPTRSSAACPSRWSGPGARPGTDGPPAGQRVARRLEPERPPQRVLLAIAGPLHRL